MINGLFLLLAFIAVVGVFVLLTRHRADVRDARHKLANSSGGKYAAVSIHTARNGCPAAERTWPAPGSVCCGARDEAIVNLEYPWAEAAVSSMPITARRWEVSGR